VRPPREIEGRLRRASHDLRAVLHLLERQGADVQADASWLSGGGVACGWNG